MEAVDLFRGAGGWSEACDSLGVEDHGVECMREANETARQAGHKWLHDDVWTFEPEKDFEGLIASPPCPTFSQAGSGKGRLELDRLRAAIAFGDWRSMTTLRELVGHVGDPRTALVLTPLHFWWRLQPEWVAWEQVPTVLPVWEACASVMREHGYNTWTGNLHAEQYGVPQTRKRAFLIASRSREVGMPTPTHSRYYPRNPTKLDEGVQTWVSMAEALGWDDPDVLLATPNHARAYDASIPRGLSQPAPTYATGHAAAAWCWVRPSTTIVGSFKPEIVAAPGYRTTVSRQNQPDSVRVTVQEAGVLQSFPADYPWQGAKGKQYLQVGNAIPPLLAAAVLRSLVSMEAS